MGKSGRKLAVALIAFVAGGLSALVAASAENAGAVDRIRSAATTSAHDELRLRPTAAPVTGRNALPLLPPPSQHSASAQAALPAPQAPGSAEKQPMLDVAQATAAHRGNALPSVSPSKPVQRVKKSASWTRRSEIIDPWSARR